MSNSKTIHIMSTNLSRKQGITTWYSWRSSVQFACTDKINNTNIMYHHTTHMMYALVVRIAQLYSHALEWRNLLPCFTRDDDDDSDRLPKSSNQSVSRMKRWMLCVTVVRMGACVCEFVAVPKLVQRRAHNVHTTPAPWWRQNMSLIRMRA